jgi:beta-glucanase (GH16 family)
MRSPGVGTSSVGGCLLAGIATCAALIGLLPATATAAVTTSCGAKLPDGAGGYRTCTFGDDFNGTSLNTNNWQPMTTATTGFSVAGECYVDDPTHIGVSNGYLTLTATKSSIPESCGPTYWTPYRSGMVITKDRFAQAYGRFQIRAKVPVGGGLQPAFWMWPNDMAYGDRSGEIDVAEWYGSYPDMVVPTLHMHNALGLDQTKTTYNCHVAGVDKGFHTYAVEWQPARFTFLYDGVPCMTVSGWDPGAPLVAPQPFDKPFFMILEQALGWGANGVTTGTPFPAKFVIDYMRAWK